MNNSWRGHPKDRMYCSTSQAAKLLGLSVTTIQNLVKVNTLQAWKTEGGHRRILMQSVIAYEKSKNVHSQVKAVDSNPHIVIVEDDEDTRNMYKAYFDKWSFPLEVLIYASAIDMLVNLHNLKPQVLLTDLHMPNMNGFEFIKTVRKHESFENIPIIAITGLSDETIRQSGGLDSDIFILKKPLDMDWFKGFLQGVMLMDKEVSAPNS